MANVRVSQGWLEVVTQESGGAVWVSQAVAEVLGQIDSQVRVSQAAVEVLGAGSGFNELRVSQAVAEVLGTIAGPSLPSVTVSNIGQYTADLTGTTFAQGTGSSAVHESSRWIVRNYWTGVVLYDSGEDFTDLTSHTIPDGSIPAGLKMVASVMYKNDADEWSFYPGLPTEFTTLVGTSEAGGMLIEFWQGDDDGPTVLISTHTVTQNLPASYGDWIWDEDIPVPAGTRYILPHVWADGGGTGDEIRIKEVQIDKGMLSGGYHPAGLRPAIHSNVDLPIAGQEIGSGPGFEIDWAEGDVVHLLMEADASMTWANLTPYRNYYLIAEQDGTGGRVLSWPTEAKFAGGTTPTQTMTAGAVDVYQLVVQSASVVHVYQVSADSQ